MNPNPHKSHPTHRESEHLLHYQGKSRGIKTLGLDRSYSIADAYGVNDTDPYWGGKVEGWE
jgi:hypothetical protein